MLVDLKRISTALGLVAAMSSAALAQGVAPSLNQRTADAVADAVRATANIQGYRVEIQAQNGMVTLSGAVGSPAQKAEVIARARHVAGVRGVVDQLQLGNDSGVQPVQYQPELALGHHRGGSGGYGGGDGGTPLYTGGGGVVPLYTSGSGGVGADGGPAPEGPAGSMGATQASMPGYPNYAWPSYAPYPNFSAVGYPTVYPWQAWPNIGPFYPYPEVPLDWRAVTLRWDDGIWWLDFKKHYTRPFITPYPFGLFAY
jgi:BON domain